jgi:hypothetical protein
VVEIRIKNSSLFILESKILVAIVFDEKTSLNIEIVLFDRTNILKGKINMCI